MVKFTKVSVSTETRFTPVLDLVVIKFTEVKVTSAFRLISMFYLASETCTSSGKVNRSNDGCSIWTDVNVRISSCQEQFEVGVVIN